VSDRKLSTNHALAVRWPRAEPIELRVLTPAEIDRLVAKMDHRYRLLVKLGCYGGMRIGELIGLRAGDVDVLRREVRIVRTVTEVGGYLHEGPPKTRAGRRSVPIPSWLAEELGAHLVGMLPDDLVWEAPRGDGPIRLASWRARYWAPATAAAELGDLRPRIHDMRHTACSLWIATGANARQVATWAGHSSVVTVFDRYGHLFPSDAAAAMERLTAYRDASIAEAPAGELVELRPS
jgi:integrase